MLVRATVALIATTITAPILRLALSSATLLAVLFRIFAIFALVSDHLRNFLLLFLGFPFGVAFFDPPAYSPLSLSSGG